MIRSSPRVRRGVLLVAILCLCWPGSTAWASPPPGEWDSRGERLPSAQQALEALDSLPEDSPAPVSWGDGGSRTGWFGQAWEDVDGDGCDTRNEILGRDLDSPDYSREPGAQGLEQATGQGTSVCPDATVWSGTLHDPYTGTTLLFRRGRDTSAAVQIDHVVPLNYLYAHGAWAWDARTRLLAANDPIRSGSMPRRSHAACSAKTRTPRPRKA